MNEHRPTDINCYRCGIEIGDTGPCQWCVVELRGGRIESDEFIHAYAKALAMYLVDDDEVLNHPGGLKKRRRRDP